MILIVWRSVIWSETTLSTLGTSTYKAYSLTLLFRSTPWQIWYLPNGRNQPVRDCSRGFFFLATDLITNVVLISTFPLVSIHTGFAYDHFGFIFKLHINLLYPFSMSVIFIMCLQTGVFLKTQLCHLRFMQTLRKRALTPERFYPWDLVDI